MVPYFVKGGKEIASKLFQHHTSTHEQMCIINLENENINKTICYLFFEVFGLDFINNGFELRFITCLYLFVSPMSFALIQFLSLLPKDYLFLKSGICSRSRFLRDLHPDALFSPSSVPPLLRCDLLAAGLCPAKHLDTVKTRTEWDSLKF